MSFISAEIIKSLAEFINITNLQDEVASALSQDVEFRLRDIIQEAQKFRRHAKRTMLTSDDINNALKLRNCQRLYGYVDGESKPFKSVETSSLGEIYYVDDDEIDLEDVLNAPLPPLNPETVLTGHWLMVEGVQPAIPQNIAPIENSIDNISRQLKQDGKYLMNEKKVEFKPLVRHVLSRELQIYFEKLVEALQSSDQRLNSAALQSIRQDNGIQQLLPYFVQYVTEQIAKNLKNLPRLTLMGNVIAGILTNSHFFVEPYLHQLMPPILSLLISKRICEDPQENHWVLRDYAASLMAMICSKYSNSYQSLQPRVTRTLLRAFIDPIKSATTHYGAIIGLKLLGSEVIKTLVMPNVVAFMSRLNQRISEQSSDIVASEELERVKNALQSAVLSYLVTESVKAAGEQPVQTIDQVDLDQVKYATEAFQLFGDSLRASVLAELQKS
ncbi:hypothetical protein MP228_001332 [Amoeboaphelidium protococcarum]|nr:hypothetical protein MP228_001332 [Amoeboaphelidium protococcarum]